MDDVLEQIARREDPRAVVWKASELPVESQGIKVLGTPQGHPEFVATTLGAHCGGPQSDVGTNTGSSVSSISVADLAALRSSTGELFVACGAACVGQKVRREP